ncbi:MAG: Hsp33 family molecular chaperone HslO [Clostridia bacterium]|nr:Hsp33 family molecular chaperone HslO [Clostridia bacterium]
MTKAFERKDELLHITLCQGEARVLLMDTTQMVQQAADIHNATPVCTAALGRLMTGTAMLGAMMKGAKDSVTVTIKGNGPAGTLMAVANGTKVKACMDNPRVNLPLRQDGKLDVGGAVGHEGRLSVVKDLGLREPYVGQTDLVSGEIADDFAMYFTKSEQAPSLVALGVLTAGEQVLSAGGILIQAMPGCSEETLDQLELRSPMFADISRELTFAPLETLVNDWFRGMEPQILGREPVQWHCGCGRERMEKALISLGRKELEQIINDDQGAELTCHFCHESYPFTTDDLKNLLAQATRD